MGGRSARKVRRHGTLPPDRCRAWAGRRRGRSAVTDDYLIYLRDVRRMSPNTIESYARDLASLSAFALGRGAAAEALDRRALEAFVRQLMSSGLAPRSVARATSKPPRVPKPAGRDLS